MSALTKIEPNILNLSQDKIDLIKQTVCKGASDQELQLFFHVCQSTGLDPMLKQIYSIPRGEQRTIQVSIDGLRLVAERTKRYSPGKESTYVYKEDGSLFSATSYIKKQTQDGTWHEVAATAMLCEYNPGNNAFWKKMAHVMLAKCAEALALRKAFPAEMSGIYVQEEMAQADVDASIITIDEDISFEKIDEYLNAWRGDKVAFKKYFFVVKNAFKWTHKKVMEEFEKDPISLQEKFNLWNDKQKKENSAF